MNKEKKKNKQPLSMAFNLAFLIWGLIIIFAIALHVV